MKGLKQRLKRPTNHTNPPKQDGTWTRQDQRVWQAVASNQPAKVAAKLSKHPDVNVNKICPNVGYSVVHYAAAKGLDDCLNILLAHKADASACDITGATPLHAAARYGHKGTTSKLLASRSVNVNLSDKNQCTALHFAAFEGHTECVKLIAETLDADLHCRDKDGRTPLMVAAAMGRVQVCQELLELDADIHHRDDTLGHTALTLAADSGHADVVRLLCERGARNSVALYDGRTAMKLAKERDRKSVIDALHIVQLTEAANRDANGPRLSTSSNKYKTDDLAHKKRHSVDSLLDKPQTFIDDLTAGTHLSSGSRTPKATRRVKEEKKSSKSNIARVKAAVEAKMKTNSRRGSDASGLSSASTPKQKTKKESTATSPADVNNLSLYTEGNNSHFYDKEMKFYDTSLSNSSLDVSSTCSAMNNISKSMDSLKPTPEEEESEPYETPRTNPDSGKQTLHMEGTDFSSRQSDSEIQRLQKANAECERKIQELESKLSHASEVAIAREQLQKNADEIRLSQYTAQKEELEKKMASHQEEVDKMKQISIGFEKQNKELLRRLSAAQQVVMTTETIKEQAKKYQDDVKNISRENDKLKEELVKLKSENDQMKTAVMKEKENESAIITHAKLKVIEAEQRCNLAEEKCSEANQRSIDAEQRIAELTKEKENVEIQMKNLKKSFEKNAEELTRNKNEVSEIMQMLWETNCSDQVEPVDVADVKAQVQRLIERLKAEEGQTTSVEADKKVLEEKLNNSLEEKNKRISDLEKQVQETEQALTVKIAENSRLEAEVQSMKIQVEEVLSQKKQLESDLGTEITKNRAELAHVQTAKVTQAEQYARSCEEVNDLRKQLNDVLNSMEKFRHNSVSCEVYNADCEKWKENCETLKTEIMEALERHAQAQLEITNKEQEISDLRVERNQSEAKSTKFEAEVATLKSKCHESDVQVNILRQQLTDAKHRVEKANEENNNLRKSRRDLTLRLSTKQGEMSETERKKVDSLRRQLEHLCKHLQDSERRYKETVAIYRGHLLAAVRGELDSDVMSALQEILKLRGKEEEKGQGSGV